MCEFVLLVGANHSNLEGIKINFRPKIGVFPEAFAAGGLA
jgi:hypothetical protein